ncbi:hypothetical protein LO762_26335 [Actinocorallia sp. API 0066]|uniref:hypothetical protein n=1 Tax=Actinocorallia sp. API 0066 TaxID=2896846 RepID=UPI001E3EB79D|nr:hypothetical protein [Actinocorallia sp. API 0066]MCD0452673.1 hypothetical protein [Actinocorallia sp. API 0066]
MGERGPEAIRVLGARVHNLRDVDVEVPLWRVVGITGLSGSGKSSLAMGVLYAEGSRRFLDGLSTFTRRRIEQAAKPDVDRVEFLPAALALRQRPPVPGRHGTVGTMSEALSVVRLMFSRLGAHVCTNGHRNPPSLAAAADEWTRCVVCDVKVPASGRRVLRVQLPGRLPCVPRPGHPRRGGRGLARPRSRQDPRGGRGPALEQRGP